MLFVELYVRCKPLNRIQVHGLYITKNRPKIRDPEFNLFLTKLSYVLRPHYLGLLNLLNEQNL